MEGLRARWSRQNPGPQGEHAALPDEAAGDPSALGPTFQLILFLYSIGPPIQGVEPAFVIEYFVSFDVLLPRFKQFRFLLRVLA